MADHDEYLEQVKALLEKGRREEAVGPATTRDTRNVRNPALHLLWADALEELGLAEDLILELNLAIRDDPDNLEPYPRLAEVLLDEGYPHRAAKVWEALSKREPHVPEHYELMGEALREAKEFDRARDAFNLGWERTKDDRFKALLKDLGFLEGLDEPPEAEPKDPSLTPGQHDLVTFTTLFASREGVFARQWVSPTGESGYTPVHEPLTHKVAENHIIGNYTIGAYPVRLDNTVNYIAFDLDAAKFVVSKAITSEKAWRSVMKTVHDTACRLLDLAAANDVPMYIEDSGFKGRHCWVFPESPVPAGVARKFGTLLRNQLLPLPAEVTVEVFPKQGSVRRGGLGNLIKLPLGIHKRTGKRSLFLDPDGSPATNQLALLRSVDKASKHAIYATAQRLQSEVAREPQPGERPEADEASQAPRLQPLPTPQLPYDPERDPMFQALMLKCPVLKAIVDKVNREGAVSNEESLVLIHTLGHLEHGADAVNHVFERCMNADPALFLKSGLKGNPMSCPKIRSRVPEITRSRNCNCAFDLTANLYPTPIIHVRTQGGERDYGPIGLTVDSMRFQQLLSDYLRLGKQLKETEILMRKYEKKLRDFFEESGVDSVPTHMGKLRMFKNDADEVTFSLEI
jgi:hypothetical protein